MADLAQRVLWTVLPNGTDAGGDRLKLSLLVSPRLRLSSAVSVHELSHFRDWLNWPNVIMGAQFKVRVDSGASVDTERVSTPDRDVWAALFPPTTFVRPYAFTDLRNKVVLSYPVAGLVQTIEHLYGQLAVRATADLPATTAYQSWTPLGQRLPEPGDVLKLLRAGGFDQFSDQPAGQIALLQAYHRPLEAEKRAEYKKMGPADPRENVKWRTHALTPLPNPEDFKKLIDFHGIVASLGQYPELLRLTGLVVDLEIARAGIPDGDHSLQLEVTWSKSDPAVHTDPDVTPTTQVHLQEAAFFVRPKSAAAPITGRFLKLQKTGFDKLQKTGFDLVQIDVDGAGLKVKNFARSVPNIRRSAFDDDIFEIKAPATVGAPSLRSAGLMLVQEGRGKAVKALFDGSGTLQDKLAADEPLPPLFAEDVVRGYRVDVREESGKWRSLCRRDGEYRLVNTGTIRNTTDEEGMIRLAAASSADGSNPDILKIHEGLFAWKGWSLCAPEPGRVVMPDDSVGEPDNAAPSGLPLETHFTPTKRSLPSLRFGRGYAVRVRLVDLAGESAPFSESDVQPSEGVSQAVVYRRYEPLEPPALALVRGASGVEAPSDGESMAHAAIRTFNDTPDKNTVATTSRARRHVVPARSTHRFAETHSVMDGPDGRVDPSLFSVLASLDHPLDETTVTTRGPTAASADVTTRYAVAPERFQLSYLPDPWALGAALKVEGAAGVNADTIHLIPFYGDAFDPSAKPAWPKALPFAIVAAETGAPDAAFDPASREFRVPLAKAERARIRLAALLPKWAVPNMAVYQMLLDQGPDAETLDRLRKLISDGQHWMLTPWRVVELVHAVQRPLITPKILEITVQRSLGSTPAIPTFRMPLQSKSTARIDLEGRWSEPLDDPGQRAPMDQSQSAHAFEVKIARLSAPSNVYSVSGHPHVFADTRYRRVTYRVDATTRFREYMPAAIRNDAARLKVSSNEVRAWAPNASPPPSPSVLYVMPTFGWTRRADAGGTSSWRTGGGLRVYLDRPWFVSGYGEMLGVVLPPGSASLKDIDGHLKPYVTQWGADPIWYSGRVSSVAPPKSAFALAKWRAPITFDGTTLPAEEGSDLPGGDFPVSGLNHPELPATVKLDVAPHAVGYDADRKLWYADIVIRPGGAYFPFVRLALARYHPVSVSGAHLSPIVLAEFQQLTPDRLAVVTHAAQDLKAKIAVYGVAPGESQTGLPTGGIFRVETQVLDVGADPDLDWHTVEQPSPPHLSPREAAMPSAATPAQSATALLEARRLLEAQDFASLLSRPDLVALIRPPLLWQGAVFVPAAPEGGRRRLLITEAETYQTGEPPSDGGAPTGARIIYAEAIEL